MKHVVWILLVLLGVAVFTSYALDDDPPVWTNVDGYR